MNTIKVNELIEWLNKMNWVQVGIKQDDVKLISELIEKRFNSNYEDQIMKKKVVLYAYEHVGGEIKFFQKKVTHSIRRPEFDIEREVEVEEEEKEPKEYWVEVSLGGELQGIRGIPEKRFKDNDLIPVVEKIPGAIQITKEDLARAWDVDFRPRSNDSGTFKTFANRLGFKE